MNEEEKNIQYFDYDDDDDDNSKLTCESMSGGFTENGISYFYNYPKFKEGYGA